MKTIINSIFFLIITTSCLAQYRDENKAMKYSSTYHLNIFINVGAGFDQINTGIITNTGEQVNLSAGGGAGLGLQLGYTMPSPSLDFSVSAFAQISVLQPPIQNADGLFSRIILEPIVKYIFEFKKIKSSINGGLGIDYVMNGKMDLDETAFPGGHHYILSYKKAVGPLALLEYQFRIKRISLTAGLKYYSITYRLESGVVDGFSYSYNNFSNEVTKIDGSGFDLTLGFGFYF